jgi:hypothetical protein
MTHDKLTELRHDLMVELLDGLAAASSPALRRQLRALSLAVRETFVRLLEQRLVNARAKHHDV